MICTSTFSDKWPIVTLGDVVNFLDHKRVPVTKSDRTPGEYQYYGANGSQGTINNYIFDEPLVLLAEDGGNFGHETRSIAYIAKGKYWVNNHAHVLQPKELIDLDYLCRVLARYDVTPFIKGATRAKLSKTDASRIPIPLPPLATQKKIAVVLEKADQLRKDCQKMEQELNSLAQSVFFDMFGDPLINESSWAVNRLGDLSSKITDGKHGDCSDDPNSGYYFVSAKNIRNGKIDYEGARQINKKEFSEVHKRTDLMPGDLVMINTGATIGRLAIADNDVRTKRATFQKSVAVIKPIVERINPVFLKYVLMLRVKDFAAMGSGSAIKNLLLSQMREFSIISPPIEKQNLFALKEEKISTLIKAININQEEAEASFNSLMQKAFKGELNL